MTDVSDGAAARWGNDEEGAEVGFHVAREEYTNLGAACNGVLSETHHLTHEQFTRRRRYFGLGGVDGQGFQPMGFEEGRLGQEFARGPVGGNLAVVHHHHARK